MNTAATRGARGGGARACGRKWPPFLNEAWPICCCLRTKLASSVRSTAFRWPPVALPLRASLSGHSAYRTCARWTTTSTGGCLCTKGRQDLPDLDLEVSTLHEQAV